jgi:hypothetical protein
MNATLITPVVHVPDVVELDRHHPTGDWSDRVALGITRALRLLADTFFAKRYGNRAIVLETVAAVPGLVGAALVHLRCLRWMQHDRGWIHALMEEAENERMHLMTFVEIARPNWLERALVLVAQAFFCTFFLLLYLLSPRTAWWATSRSRRWSATASTCRRSMPAASRTSPRRRSPWTTGSCPKARACARWCWPCARTKPGTATSTTGSRTSCGPGVERLGTSELWGMAPR